MDVMIQRLDEALPAPSYAHPGDAGLDLRAAEDGELKPFERALVPCGFAMAIPDGFAGLVIPRSGLAAKHGISIVNAPGLVDSGYRGEIKVALVNLDPHESFSFKKGERIAQMMIVATPSITLHNISALPNSDRGAQGFGSSGVS
ncbi:dUTP diphosphatase [Adlercreutzia sp. R25]|uniref:Deoxyuridine 5'-triphosphate nucleotidohydrolase n=1 Tax=Adlercreutzia shanghongiae TaxID=3111773 RepID=A0ABU6IWS0_9ACTN|nr:MULTISPECIES: dUTP diphosphatase [unclassified Adlercreutzia]MEC4272425.1 dUTP diphosphatase [Adlercreutzia sp. R25]MEC4294288.1 dUTP diphosphatase [Adlercreutzia sp. R22]